ncbi:MAG: membrane protein insertion efficiency factor YidD [Lentisphaeria bacterium]|nr:membrane protein insertion efficiency factor YidD [Lentisphaeria bacterium]
MACLLAIHVYRKGVSPIIPACCRFEPTCSAYAAEAFKKHGFWRGAPLVLSRLLRCQPFYRGPLYDPVPSNAKHGAEEEE